MRTEVRKLAGLGFPIVISLAAATLIGVVDTIMIAPLGTVPLAAASITASVSVIFFAALYGFVTVAGVRMAEAHGKGSAAELSTATRTAMAVALIAGLMGAGLMLALRPLLVHLGQPAEVIAALGGYWTAIALMLIPYTMFYTLKALFDAIDAPWVGVCVAFVAVALNIPANLVLIHGIGTWAGFGLLGAGLASVLSESVSLAIAWWIWRRAALTRAARADGARSGKEMRVQVREGLTIALGYFGEGGAYAIAGLMMGWFGAQALAATRIVSSVGEVLYMVPIGISIAVSIKIGQAIGAEQRARVARIGLAALIIIVAWMSVVMVGVLLARGGMARGLSSDPQVIAIAVSMFVVIACLQIVDGVQGAMLGALRGMMDNRVPVVITLMAYWIVGLPLGYVLGFVVGLGPNGVWIGYGAGLLFAAVVLTQRFFRLSAG